MSLVIILVGLAVPLSVVQCDQPNVVRAKFNETYYNQTNPEGNIIFTYKPKTDSVVRIWLNSTAAAQHEPLLAVVRQSSAILSWQVPLLMETQYTYSEVERTLCPFNVTNVILRTLTDKHGSIDYSLSANTASPNNGTAPTEAPRPLYTKIRVELSSSSSHPVDFTLRATEIPDSEFNVKLDTWHHLTVSPSTPRYYKITLQRHIDTVIVQANSSVDPYCMIMSIQPVTCPVFDLDNNVEFAGMYQTVTKKGAITIRRDYFSTLAQKEGRMNDSSLIDSFYIVFVVRPNDRSCHPKDFMDRIDPSDPSTLLRTKAVSFMVYESIAVDKFLIATMSPVAALFGVYIFVIGLSLLFHVTDRRAVIERENLVIGNSNAAGRHARRGSNESGVSLTVNGNPLGTDTLDSVADHARQTRSPTLGDYDALDDAAFDKDVIRSKANLTLADLARKPHKQLGKKYRLYHWNLITISVFYALPVVQLVYSSQMMLVVTGDQDTCYYNFLCAQPFWRFMAFNNVFSNLGYVMLGILFLILVKSRDLRHQLNMEQNEELETRYGIPRHFGLFYAMGIALVMQGVMSACYHVCPTYTNFQFDTAYMYIIACLGILKIYQQRHPDINANAHISYCVMAFIIFSSVIGVEYNGYAFYCVFSVFMFSIFVLVIIEFYYKGRWKLNRHIILRIRQEWSSNMCSRAWFRCQYPGRMLFLAVLSVLNVGFITFGIVIRPKDFPSFLVANLICNLLTYALYYLLMKLATKGEKLGPKTILYAVLSAICWSASLYFYNIEIKSWDDSPAQSRELNQPCMLLNFYDSHDIWHFLSALSLFFSFMVVLVIDDDLAFTPHDLIPVF